MGLSDTLFFFLSFFPRPNLITDQADGKHPISHFDRKNPPPGGISYLQSCPCTSCIIWPWKLKSGVCRFVICALRLELCYTNRQRPDFRLNFQRQIMRKAISIHLQERGSVLVAFMIINTVTLNSQ